MPVINPYDPLEVDFNNSDEDHAVRLCLPPITDRIRESGLQLVEGGKVWTTDGEIEMTGTLHFRNGMWVAVPDENGFKDVSVMRVTMPVNDTRKGNKSTNLRIVRQ